jgi:hypothetical protein
MLRSDFLILNEARREVARTEVILERMHLGVTRGVIYFGGELLIRMGVKRLDGQKYYDVLVGTLVGLEKRLRRIPGVADVFFRFTNIEKYGGFWRHVKTKTSSAHPGFGFVKNAKTTEEDESPDGKDEEK